MKIRFTLITLIFFVFGCTSLPQHKSLYNYIPGTEPFIYEIRDVNVSIDYVNENEIANQVRILMESSVISNSDLQNMSNVVYIDFNVLQRSFLQNIDQKTTIFINVIGYDSDRNILIRENYYITGKDTFLSSVTQYKYVSKITNNLLKYQESVERSFEK